jgi:hypothetical protein
MNTKMSHSYEAQERVTIYWGHMQDTCESCSSLPMSSPMISCTGWVL